MKQMILQSDLPALCLGAAVLGSGGGGDTAILFSFVNEILAKSGPVELISVSELKEDDLVIPMAYIGSPAVSLAAGPSLALFISLIEKIMADNQGRNIVLMPAEIGGCNALTPLVAASYLKLPLLDADLIGRAFPKVHMCKPAVNFPNQPQLFYLANRSGDVTSQTANDVYELELTAREFTVKTGGSASIATFIFNGAAYQRQVIEGSITRALSIGLALLSNQDYEKVTGCLQASGTIAQLTRVTKNGFLMGSVTLETTLDKMVIAFQNEYLSVSIQNCCLIQTPDIIVLFNKDTRAPVASESLSVGQHIDLVSFPAPLFWKEPSACRVVSLDQFSV